MLEPIATPGNVVRVTTQKDEIFTGYISSLFSIDKEDGVLEGEFLLHQTKAHTGEPFGMVVFPVSYIKNIDVISDYSCLKETNQDSILNVAKIKQLMEDTGTTFADIVSFGKVSKSVLSKALNGKTKDISLSTAIGIAKGLDVPIDWIVNKNV